MQQIIFAVIFFTILSNFQFECLTASMSLGGFADTNGGGSSTDTAWIDLMTVLEITQIHPNLTELRTIYDATEMGFKLEQSRHITILLPNNDAIEKQLKPALPNLSYQDLITILKNHVLSEVIKTSELSLYHKKQMTTMADSTVDFEVRSIGGKRQTVILNNGSSKITANVIGKEIDNANGVAYIIDKLILTSELEKRIQEAIALTNQYDQTKQLPTAPNYIKQTNMRHWLYGRYGGTPTNVSISISDNEAESLNNNKYLHASRPNNVISKFPSQIANS